MIANIRKIHSCLKHSRVPRHLHPDAFQEIVLFILGRYRPGKDLNIGLLVSWALADWGRKNNRLIHVPRNHKKRHRNDHNPALIPIPIDTPHLSISAPDPTESIDNLMEIDTYLNWVSTDASFILRNSRKTGGPLLDRECADFLKISDSRVEQIRDQALDEIRTRLGISVPAS